MYPCIVAPDGSVAYSPCLEILCDAALYFGPLTDWLHTVLALRYCVMQPCIVAYCVMQPCIVAPWQIGCLQSMPWDIVWCSPVLWSPDRLVAYSPSFEKLCDAALYCGPLTDWLLTAHALRYWLSPALASHVSNSLERYGCSETKTSMLRSIAWVWWVHQVYGSAIDHVRGVAIWGRAGGLGNPWKYGSRETKTYILRSILVGVSSLQVGH